MSKLYAERDVESSGEFIGIYTAHVCAMTDEKLHSKSDIAAELAHRDLKIKELSDFIIELRRMKSFERSKMNTFNEYLTAKNKLWREALVAANDRN